MLQLMKSLLFRHAKAAPPQHKALVLNPIEDCGPDYECPAVWRKEGDRKHAVRAARDHTETQKHSRAHSV